MREHIKWVPENVRTELRLTQFELAQMRRSLYEDASFKFANPRAPSNEEPKLKVPPEQIPTFDLAYSEVTQTKESLF